VTIHGTGLLAVALSLGLFGFWAALGYALLALCHSQRNLRQNLLIAPAVGSAIVLLVVFWLSRLGLPVARFGPAVLAAFVILAGALLAATRPFVPWRRSAPFGAVLVLTFALTGRPLLEFGFEWLSFATEDMGTYVLSAQRLLLHGFFDRPDPEVFARGLDYTLHAWRLDISGHRPGSQLLLAWVSSVTGLGPHQGFMPTVMALHLVLVSAVCGLVCRVPRRAGAAVLTGLMLAISPLMALGALYQRFPQVWGLGLLSALTVVLWRPGPPSGGRPRLLRLGLVPAILGSAVAVVYSEILPLLALASGVYLLVALVRGQPAPGRILALGAVATALSLLALNVYVRDTLRFLIATLLRQSTRSPESMLFPFYFIPSGLAQFWGFMPLGGLRPEPWLSLAILTGAAVLLAAAGASTWLAWRGEPAAIWSLVLLALALGCFVQERDFLLDKIGMYVQPFLLASLAIAALTVRRRTLAVAGLTLLALGGVRTQMTYLERSRGSGERVEIAGSSRSRLVAEFRDLIAARPARLFLDTSAPVMAKLQATYLVGIPSTFSSGRFWTWAEWLDKVRDGVLPPAPRVAADDRALVAAAGAMQATVSFAWGGGASEASPFVAYAPVRDATADQACESFLLTTGRHTVFNRRGLGSDTTRSFVLAPCGAVRNHLVFVESSRGQHYQARDRDRASLYQLEPDPVFHRDQTMAGLGRYLLARVLNPSRPARLALHVTRSLAGDGDNRLPPAIVIGTERHPFPLVGRGSARVFSPPLVTQSVGGLDYLGLDMGMDGRQFPRRAPGGLMRAYGRDVAQDHRRLTAFVRDISLVTEAEYAALAPPSALRVFPRDLADPSVEYSGLYEDGWVGEDAFVRLSRGPGASVLRVRGSVPSIGAAGFTSECVVLVDGREAARAPLAVGRFTLEAVVPAGSGRARIDVRFSRVQPLPAPDGRPVAAHLDFIGFDG
jgi:hypothetical protein